MPNCYYYELKSDNFKHMDKYFHINEDNYNRILELIDSNKLLFDYNFMNIFYEADINNNKYGIYIFSNDCVHPEILMMKSDNQNIGKNILEMYFNRSNKLCFNIFKTKKYCSCDKIHVMDDGIIGVIEYEKHSSKRELYEESHLKRSRSRSVETSYSKRSRSYERSNKQKTHKIINININKKHEQRELNEKITRTKEKIRWIRTQIKKLTKREKKLNKKLELINTQH